MPDGTTATFISRRDAQFREYPPASAQLAIIVPFFGDLALWVRASERRGWQFPAGTRKAGETIGETAKRRLRDATRLAPSRLDLLGCLARNDGGRARVAYVYTCRVDRLSWAYERPEASVEIGVFVTSPRPMEGEWNTALLDVARRARSGR